LIDCVFSINYNEFKKLAARMLNAVDGQGVLVSSIKILVVDDDSESRDLIREVLESNGYTADAVADGVAARQVLERNPGYRLVIADVRMPKEGGLELLRNLRRLDQSCGFILMSSYLSHSDWKLAKDLGAQAFLEKPFTLADLIKTVAGLAPGNPHVMT
jgi:CheY-like chemotaxis protein